ncbi:hypothetical protein K466DRAFT_651411 [Polyporus arcularius HHB13444]|uniref:F-box domain-containing protein n=1 Tax=Polyporus arcularius HHB13444 TaxID=1314778 RepID=A0A5C3PXB8_9APHY|nr:hypothetical protein K466DRAFT_651411 [Polyporus arcularius HHB13444]
MGSVHLNSRSGSELSEISSLDSDSCSDSTRSVSETSVIETSSDSESCSEHTTSYSPAGAYRFANRESLSEKREKLLQRKKVPQRELFKTLVALNDTQPVNTLPRELLIYVAEYLRPSSDARHTDQWIGRLYVCRRWYDIFTTMPSFWRQIYVSSHPEWLELCLSRCAGMPADIYFTGRFSLQATLPMLEEHGHLVRAITYSVLRSSWASDIAQLLALPLSALQKVEISVKTKSRRRALVELSPESYAHLQSLRLLSCDAPHDPGAYASLRTLRLVDSSWSISFHQFLDILVSAEQLQELVLDNCLSGLRDCPDGFPSTYPPTRSPATLARLQTLQLTNVRSSLGAQILAHIRVPQATHINVRTYANSDDPQPSVWALLPKNLASFSPIFSTATSVTVGFTYSDRCELVAQCATRHLSMQVSLKGYRQFSDRWEAMEGFMRTFTDAPVRSLTVTGAAQYVSGATWEHVFRSLPMLEELDIRGSDYFGSVFAALRSASAHGGGIMCCPDLSTVSLRDYSYAPGFQPDPFPQAMFDQLLDALRMRAERGVRLEKLKITSCYRHWRPDEGCEDLTVALKSLVSNVESNLIASRWQV